MSKGPRFWRNVAIIGLAHVVVLMGLLGWSRKPKSVGTQDVVWMSGGAGDGATAETKAALPKPSKVSAPPPEPKSLKREEPEEDHPILASAKSDIELPSASATPRPKPTPTHLTTPKPTPK